MGRKLNFLGHQVFAYNLLNEDSQLAKIFFKLISIIVFSFVFLSSFYFLKSNAFAQACKTTKVCTAKNVCSMISGTALQVLGAPPGNCPVCNTNIDCLKGDYFLPGVPGFPQTFYGTIKNCGKNVVLESKVEVKVCNGPSFNSYFIGNCGSFSPGNTCYAVSIQGDMQCSAVKKGGVNGDPLNFYINGRPANIRGWWTNFISGSSTRWDIEGCNLNIK